MSAATPATATKSAGDSEKLQSLQNKVTESEITIASLKAELDSANEKLTQSHAEVDGGSKDAAADALRAEHAANIEKMSADHASELKSLRTQLAEAETKRQELEAKSVQDLDEAAKSAANEGDETAAAMFEDLKQSHQSQLQELEKELAAQKEQANAFKAELESHKDAAKGLHEEKALALDNLERELKGRDQVIENLNTEMAKLDVSKEKAAREAEESAKQSTSALGEEIASLKAKLTQAESAQQSSEDTANALADKDREVAELKQAIESLKTEHQGSRDASTKELDDKVKELAAAHESSVASMKAEHEEALASAAATHAKELASAKEAAESTGTSHSQQLQELRDSLTAFEATAKQDKEVAIRDLKTAHETELQSLREKVDASQQALTESQKALENKDSSAQAIAVGEIEALKGKVESLESQLSTRRGEIESLETEIHSKVAQAEDLQQSLVDLEGKFREKDDEQESKLKPLEEKAQAAERALQEQSQEAATAAERHTKDIEDLKTGHATEIEKVKGDAGSHQTAMNDLQRQHDELLSAHRELGDTHTQKVESLEAELKSAYERHAAEIEETKAKLQTELQASQASASADADAEHSRAIEALLSTQDAKLSSLRDELETSHQAKLGELQKSHDAALADVNSQLAQSQAAAQDTSTADGLKATITHLEGKLQEAEKARAAAEEKSAAAGGLSDKHDEELSKLQAELAQKHQAELSQLKDQHGSAACELENIKAQNRSMEEKMAKGEKDLNDQIDKNLSLLNQLGDVDSTITANRRRVRELEAELGALKAEQDGTKPTGLEGSRWAEGPTAGEGEDLGSSIEGTVRIPVLLSVPASAGC